MANNAPTASGSATLAPIDEDSNVLPGATIASLFGGNFTDPDGSSSLMGIAVAIHTFDGTKGDWEYSTNGGLGWIGLGEANISAIRLHATDMLRFSPAPDYHGSATFLLAHLIETGYPEFTSGTTTNLSLPGAIGGTSFISATGVVLSETINSVIDGPTITVPEDADGGINNAEVADGTPVIVSLGPDAAAGDILTVNWGGEIVDSYTLAPTDIINGTTTVTVPAGTITSVGDGSIEVTASINGGPDSNIAQVTVDTTADVGGDLSLNFDHTLIGGPGASAVAFTVAGLDPDIIEAEVTFSDGGFIEFSIDASTGAGVVDLSWFNGTMNSVLHVTDAAGNTTSVPGASLQVDSSADTDHNLMLTIAGNPNIGAGDKGAVGFSIAGTDPDVTAAEVTFSDSVGNFVTYDAFAATVADLSSFVDGPVSAVLVVTDALGNTASTNGVPPHNINSTADTGAPAVLTVDRLISASEVGAASFTVTGVDADFSFGFVIFTDSLGHTPSSPTFSITGNGTYSIDLSDLADGPITSTMHIQDTANNSVDVAGNLSALNTTSSISIGLYRWLGVDAAAQLADFSEVILTSNAGGIAGLTTTEIAGLGPAGVTSIHSVTGSFTLTRAQYDALPATVALTAADTVTLRDTGANLADLDAGEMAALVAAGIDKLDASDNVLSLTAQKYQNLVLSGLSLTASDVVTLADTPGNLLGLNLASLAANGIDRIDAIGDSLSLTVAQYKALGKVTSADGDTVTLADTSASIQSLVNAQFAALAGKGIDKIDATNDLLTLSVGEYGALNGVELSPSDVVTLRDTGLNLAGQDFSALALDGIAKLDASNNAMSLTVAEYQALSAASLKLTASDVVTLADVSSHFVGLDFAPLAAAGIDRIDATGDNSLSLILAQFNALGKVLLTDADAVTVSGTPGDDSFAFSLQAFTGNDKADGGGGTDTLRLGHALTSTDDAQITGIERVVLTSPATLNLANQTEAFTIIGSTGADSITGGSGKDSIVGAQNDTLLDGGAGSADVLLVGAAFTSTSNAQIANIEQVRLASAVTLNLANQTEGFTITGSSGADSVTGGSGADSISAGAGNDTIRGGAGGDDLAGGAGADTFVYSAPSQSTSTTHDTVTDFNAGEDRFDFDRIVTQIQGFSGTVNSGGSFDNDLNFIINDGIHSQSAVVVSVNGGDLAGHSLLVVAADSWYQAGSDYVVDITGFAGTLTVGNFI